MQQTGRRPRVGGPCTASGENLYFTVVVVLIGSLQGGEMHPAPVGGVSGLNMAVKQTVKIGRYFIYQTKIIDNRASTYCKVDNVACQHAVPPWGESLTRTPIASVDKVPGMHNL